MLHVFQLSRELTLAKDHAGLMRHEKGGSSVAASRGVCDSHSTHGSWCTRFVNRCDLQIEEDYQRV
mgnify:CR=1 FL=1